jgi:hypothetical protein
MLQNTLDQETKDRIGNIVRNNLLGDEKIVSIRHYETIDRIDNGEHQYHEEIYCVIWFSESRRPGFEYGTHRVSFNNLGAEALCWGGYDMTQKKALADLDRRMENAPTRP